MKKRVLPFILLSFFLSCQSPIVNTPSIDNLKPVMIAQKILIDFVFINDEKIVYVDGKKIEEVNGQQTKLIYQNYSEIFSFSVRKDVIAFNSYSGETSILLNQKLHARFRTSYGYIPSPLIRDNVVLLGENHVRFLSFNGKELKYIKLPQRMLKILEGKREELVIWLADRQRIVKIKGGTLEKIETKIDGLISDITLKGDTLFVSTSKGKIYLVDIVRKKEIKVIETNLGEIASIALHPQNQLIAAISLEGKIVLIDYKTNTHKKLPLEVNGGRKVLFSPSGKKLAVLSIFKLQILNLEK